MRRMIEKETELIVSGSIAEDSIKVVGQSLLGHFSELHPQFSVSLFVDSMERHRGGTGANIAYTMALLGEHPILLGSLSQFDTEYLAHLQSKGVNIDHIHKSKKETSRFDVVTDKENNQFATFYPGAMFDSSALTLVPWKGKSAYAIISAHDPDRMHQQVIECVRHGIPYCFDIGQQTNNSDKRLVLDGINNAHVLIANAHEMETLAKKIGSTIEEMKTHVPIVITTLGKDGARIEGSTVEEPIHIPVAPVTKVVDPTGAGDAWRAGFFVGLKQGHNLATAGRWGAVAASFAIEKNGGQEHNFTMADFQKRLRPLLVP